MAQKSGLALLAKLDRIANTHPNKAVRDGARREAAKLRGTSTEAK